MFWKIYRIDQNRQWKENNFFLHAFKNKMWFDSQLERFPLEPKWIGGYQLHVIVRLPTLEKTNTTMQTIKKNRHEKCYIIQTRKQVFWLWCNNQGNITKFCHVNDTKYLWILNISQERRGLCNRCIYKVQPLFSSNRIVSFKFIVLSWMDKIMQTK